MVITRVAQKHRNLQNQLFRGVRFLLSRFYVYGFASSRVGASIVTQVMEGSSTIRTFRFESEASQIMKYCTAVRNDKPRMIGYFMWWHREVVSNIRGIQIGRVLWRKLEFTPMNM